MYDKLQKYEKIMEKCQCGCLLSVGLCGRQCGKTPQPGCRIHKESGCLCPCGWTVGFCGQQCWDKPQPGCPQYSTIKPGTLEQAGETIINTGKKIVDWFKQLFNRFTIKPLITCSLHYSSVMGITWRLFLLPLTPSRNRVSRFFSFSLILFSCG